MGLYSCGSSSRTRRKVRSPLPTIPALLAASTNTKPTPAQVPVPVLVPYNDAVTSVLSDLTKQFNNGNFNNNISNRNIKCNNEGPRLTRKFQTDQYCWSHGCDLSGDHTSANCNNRKTGHQIDATIDNCNGRSGRYLLLVCPTSSWSGWRKIPEVNSNSNLTIISNNHFLQSSSRKLAFSSRLPITNRFSSLTYNDEPTPLAADSGCTIHLVNKSTLLLEEITTPNGITITTASSDTISGISKGQLPFILPKKASI